MTCNRCGNGLRGSSEKRILQVIDEHETELSPLEIYERIRQRYPAWKVSRSTIRCLLRRLYFKGKLVQPYPGAYCNKITYGVRFVPLLVHNIALSVQLVEDVVHWEYSEVVGGVKVFVCFGSERRKISGKISCGAGMSKAACLLAVHRWIDVAEERLGHCLPETLVVSSFEQNRDFLGFRLDGSCKCMTKKGLFGLIERVYQKQENVVRVEHKVSRAMSLGEFEALLRGGVTGYNFTQLAFSLFQKMDTLTDAIKYNNHAHFKNQKVQDAILEWIYKQNDRNSRLDSKK